MKDFYLVLTVDGTMSAVRARDGKLFHQCRICQSPIYAEPCVVQQVLYLGNETGEIFRYCTDTHTVTKLEVPTGTGYTDFQFLGFTIFVS